MKKIILHSVFIGIAFAVALVLPNSSQAQLAFTFTRDLKLGMTHSDVKQLQIMLNADLATRITTSGAGSPGNETSYFGALTKAAVIRFQNKYAQEVLAPGGLTYGTGLVGPATRKKLNTMAAGAGNVSQNSQSSLPATIQAPVDTGSVTFRSANGGNTASQSQSATVAQSTGMRLFSVYPYQARPGDTITLTGKNMSSNTVVSFGNAGSATVSSVTSDGSSAKVTIPSNIGYSDYILTISHNNSSSANQGFAVHLIVSANPKSAPVISGVSPSVISSLDAQITVTGSGFTQSNGIYTGFGTITGVASANGTSLTFSPSQLPKLKELQSVLRSRQQGALLYVDFYIINENGMTQKTGRFNVQ
jgi:peptidoglycan hydrolase-like protein with peptidoglycan-binding domain